MFVDPHSLIRTLNAARERLLAARVPAGHWEGELSSSALSTATAVCALTLLDHARHTETSSPLVQKGLAWLAKHQNADGGWGDTVDSPSNISTTALCWAALGASSSLGETHQPVANGAAAWLERQAGNLTPSNLARAITAAYGHDRTFSAPILTMCALAGRLGSGRQAWKLIPALPFELACCPHAWYRRLGLPVVSYALPALIAIGQARHHHRPTNNPIARALRSVTRGRTLGILQAIQPASGGFLEASPITSFVVMSLASIGKANHPVAERGRAFLAASVRDDGSWPIDTNLATWVTTLSVNALAGSDDPATSLSADERDVVLTWLLRQQHRCKHPYTHAAPGGWAWTDLSGGVPDADDTPGALLALWHLAARDPSGAVQHREVRRAARAGVRWLLDLQNADGGMPAFCRGWGKMPFDRSTPDLTAHTLRAWHTWRQTLTGRSSEHLRLAIRRAVRYLIRNQRDDGAWVPLWFGNQHSPDQENPLYGTTRVLRAGQVISVKGRLGEDWMRARRRGMGWLMSAQNTAGGWGGAPSVQSSIEETGLALEALAGAAAGGADGMLDSIKRASTWLVEHTDGGARFDPAPIGLYFAKLWYHERLYPLIFTVAALEQVRRAHTKVRDGQHPQRTETHGLESAGSDAKTEPTRWHNLDRVTDPAAPPNPGLAWCASSRSY